MYKLIALDMDGTLLNNQKEISEVNLKSIKEARDIGVKVILATGRPKDGVRHYLEKLEMLSGDEYVVAFNGGLVQHCGTGEIISKVTLQVSDYEELFKLSESLGCHIQASTESEVITPKSNEIIKEHARLNDIPLIEMSVEDVDSNTIIAKVMFVDNEEILDHVIANMPNELRDKYTIIRSDLCYLEFLHKNVNKGAGVSRVAERLNISKEEVICIGDVDNDFHMIEYAGLGVAMGNAFESIKNMADYVTFSNEEDGVAHVIEKFILQR